MKIDQQILAINRVICTNIDSEVILGRGLTSQNIIAQLRNLIEHIALKEFSPASDIPNTYENIQKSLKYIYSRGELKFLWKFHKYLKISASHYTPDEENSERLMLKYLAYLFKIRNHVENRFNLSILENLESYPLNEDSALFEYYRKISERIKESPSTRVKSDYDDRYYIQKIKPFFVGSEIFYEVTFTRAIDKASKFDRTIAFTRLDIMSNYSVKLSISKCNIDIVGKEMPIQIIDNWEVSIRTCELNNFADILGDHPKLGGTKDVYELMNHLKLTNINLHELVVSDDDYFESIKGIISKRTQVQHFLKVLEKCRKICQENLPGSNVLKYLLYNLNNRIIKKQRFKIACPKLSDLYLQFGCIPFDQMPYNTSLIYHNPSLIDLIECIEIEGREHEIFARFIKNNTETKGMLYTPIDSIKKFENIDSLIDTYNSKLYHTHLARSIDKYNGHLVIRGYEEDTINIVEKLIALSDRGITNYENSIDNWINHEATYIDCDEKKAALKAMFKESEVALIYGAAGTGKSTMINHISNYFSEESKLYLANTNPAVENLNRKVKTKNSEFKTIAKYLAQRATSTEYDILVIDECSTVSNKYMLDVLNKTKFKLLILVGDIYQIESIRFGNWFSIVKSFMKESSIFELTKPYRTTNDELIAYWDQVRKIEDNILELSTKREYSVTLDESIFDHYIDDEIILCLNYDGLYGINNINSFLQASNPNEGTEWGIDTYKVNDPILFIDNDRFKGLLYNNLKGKILDIQVMEDQIEFKIEVYVSINGLQAESYDLQLLDEATSGSSVVKFRVNKYSNTDEDDEGYDTIVPFQVAYAVSIHKAQGLEFDSVKIIITNEVEEMITHNIFYTAITRARKELKIYWSPETENYVLNNLKSRNNSSDIALIRAKHDM